MQRNFIVFDREEPLTLYDCQIRPLREAFRRDDDGNYIYNTILWSWPKKSAKSTVVAAVADYTCATSPRKSVKLVANDLKQADSRVGMYLRENLKSNPDRLPTVRIKPSGYRIDYLNRSTVEMIPIDPNGEAGGNDDLIVYSELWGWKDKAHVKMWDEMTLSPTKYGNSQRWVDTYAGFFGESPILENLYKLGHDKGYQIWPDLEVWANPDAKLLCVWVTKPMLPWQLNTSGRAYYKEQSNTVSVDGFRRMHQNQWVSPLEAFIPEPWWLACQKVIPALKPRQDIVLALDAGISSDCFAMVGVTRTYRPDRKIDITEVRYARKWTPPPDGKLDFGEPEKELVRLCMAYNVVMVVYDPHQMHDMMTRFKRRMISACHEFDQGSRRLEADKHLYDMIRDNTLEWDEHVAGMTDLKAHIMNANKDESGEKREKLRIVKRANDEKIDLAVALSMAAHEAKRLNLA